MVDSGASQSIITLTFPITHIRPCSYEIQCANGDHLFCEATADLDVDLVGACGTTVAISFKDVLVTPAARTPQALLSSAALTEGGATVVLRGRDSYVSINDDVLYFAAKHSLWATSALASAGLDDTDSLPDLEVLTADDDSDNDDYDPLPAFRAHMASAVDRAPNVSSPPAAAPVAPRLPRRASPTQPAPRLSPQLPRLTGSRRAFSSFGRPASLSSTHAPSARRFTNYHVPDGFKAKPGGLRPENFAKSKRLPFDGHFLGPTRPLEEIHVDLLGPIAGLCSSTPKYAVLFTCATTGYKRIYGVRARSEFPLALTWYIREMGADTILSRASDVSVAGSRLYLDGARELNSAEVRTILDRYDMRATHNPPPYTSSAEPHCGARIRRTERRPQGPLRRQRREPQRLALGCETRHFLPQHHAPSKSTVLAFAS